MSTFKSTFMAAILGMVISPGYAQTAGQFPVQGETPQFEPTAIQGTETRDDCQTFTNPQTQETERSCPDQQGSSATQQTTDFVGNIGELISLVHGGFGRRGDGNQTAANGLVLGGAAGEDMADSGRLSPYAVVNNSDTDRRATDRGLGYQQDGNTLVLGTDYRITDSLIAGATLGYLEAETDFDNNRGGNDNETLLLGVYVSKYWNRAFVDALITYGQVNLDIERINASTLFEGDTDGDFNSAEVTAGLNFNHQRWRITPTVRLLHLRGELDGYTETTSTGGPTRTFDDQPFDSLQARAALQADYVILMNWGVLIPTINLAYFHEYLGADRVNSNSFGLTVQHIPEDPVKNFKQGRLGVSAQFKGGLSAFLSYDRLIDHQRLDRDRFALGVRYELP